MDFLRRSLRVERQRLQDGQIGPPKTPKTVRTVPLGHVALEELAAHLAVYPSSEWLFTDDQGGPLSYQAGKREFTRTCSRAGVEQTTHDLRHFYASALIAGGASVKQVQAVLGHASAVFTLRTYAHLRPGDEDRTRSVIDAALNTLRTGCGLDAQTGGAAADQTHLEAKSGPQRSYFLVSQKIRATSSTLARSSAAFSASTFCLVADAALRVFQTRSWSSGNFSRCSALK